MNYHFISFLVDILSWLAWGVMYGKYIAKFDRLNIRSSSIVSVKFALASLLGGLIATAERALPEVGFATYHFFIAVMFSFIFSLTYFVRFRRYVTRWINTSYKIIVQSPVFKKVYSYK